MVNRIYSQTALNQTSIPNTTEAIAQVSPPLSVTTDGDSVEVSGTINITTGTGTTAITIRCRRGTGLTGAIVGVAEVHPQAASTQDVIAFDFQDFPGAVAGLTYSITMQQTAGTGTGTLNACVSQWSVGV